MQRKNLLSTLDKNALKAAAGRATIKTARSVRNSLRQKMIKAKPSGNLYPRRGGEGFRRFHQASRRGERPAVDTGNLANKAIKSTRLSETSAQVFYDQTAAPYAGYLVNMGRVLISEDDLKEGAAELTNNVLIELKKVLKNG